MRGAALLLGLMVLVGCDALQPPVQSLSMLDGAAVVQGPAGYCIDPQASRASTGFAVLAGCGLVSRLAVMPPVEGLITVQIGAQGSASVNSASSQIAAMMRTPTGARMLSASGQAETVVIEAVERAEGLVVVRFTDNAPSEIAGLGPTAYRAFLDIGGRLTTVSLRFYDRAPVAAGTGAQLLAQAVAVLRAANAAPAAP